MKFVIWGAGYYGKIIIKILGTARIKAVIDTDEKKVGAKLFKIPIISIDEYLRHYKDYIIIICVRNNVDIISMLNNYHVTWYISALELPPRILEECYIPFNELNISNYALDCRIGIYGITLYGLLLYEYLLKNGYANIFFISDKSDDFIKKLCCYNNYRFAGSEENLEAIFVTNRYIKNASLIYRNASVNDFWDYSYRLKKYRNESLVKFKGIHKEERCFIVATGPSLQIRDLDCLNMHHEITMSVNKIYRGFHLTKWRPNYYVLGDAGGINEYGEVIERIADNFQSIFIADREVDFWEKEIALTHLYKYHQIQDRQEDWMRVSDDFVRGIYARGTIIVECLQIAFYMGFSKIYLIGTDCDYKGFPNDGGNHFVKDYERGTVQQLAFPLEEVFGAYQAMQYYADRHGIKIYNATRGGKLEVFERVDFDSLF